MSGPLNTPGRQAIALLVGVVTLAFTTIVVIPPFYDWFCRVTGYGGTTATAAAGSDVILDQTIKIRFDGSLAAGMPWTFHPVQHEMDLRIGETGVAFYEAYNPTDRVVAGTASYNVAPESVGSFFTKIECFCFTQQVLQPGERVMMPVSFYVDPAFATDLDGQFVKSITLSYTFYETELPEGQAALKPDDAASQAASN
ncbi:MAG: cytochrome c oxidase assembly protein [Paracoccaceae bacterium]